MPRTTKLIARAGVIGALYIMLSLLTFTFSSGAIQLRLAEGLTLLALLYFETVPALFIGCFLTNIITGCALIDAVMGALITLVAGALTYLLGRFIKNHCLKVILGGLFPIVLNALLLPLVWYWCYGQMAYAYLVQAGVLLLSQAVSVYGVGVPIYYGIKRFNEREND